MNITHNNRIFYLKLLAMALVIFGARLWFIQHFGSAVPFWDQWYSHASSLFLPWLNGTLTFSDLVANHNEHRILLTRLWSLLLWMLNGGQWNPLLEIVANALLSTLIAIILVMILNPFLGQNSQNWLLFMVALLWSMPYGWENILAGFQSSFYFMVLFSLITLWGLLLHDNFSFKWWIGAISALLAYFSLASGFFTLLVIMVLKLYLIAIDTNRRRSHFPTLFISFFITIFCVILIAEVPYHAALKADSVSVFFLTFGKALAWPWISYSWLSLIVYGPFFALVFRILYLRRLPSLAELFILALGGWVILQAAGIAYARGNVSFMAWRYMEILAFGIVVNLVAFYFMNQAWYAFPRLRKPYLNHFAGLWILLMIFGIVEITVNNSWPMIQLKHSQSVEQLKNTREFLRTGQLNALTNKPHLHIPYPSPEYLADLLSNPHLRAILPHHFAMPPLLQSASKQSAFVPNGFYPTTGKYQNETVLGSYNMKRNQGVGQFESEFIQLNYRVMEIPVAGYLGKEGLSLQLLVEGQEKPIMITPPQLPKEQWVSCYVPVPSQPFKIVAIDNNSALWFAFAMPRGIKTLSFLAIWLLEHGTWFFVLGISLFFITFYSKVSIIIVEPVR